MDLRGRTALVTGATGGLGQAIVRGLAQRGAVPILTGRRADLLQALAAETGGRAIAGDLADAADVERVIDSAGDVDVLVANAGVPADGPIDEYSVEQIDRALDVNLRAPILLAHALTGAMVARGEGHMVFISSLSGKVATPGSALYSATKFGLRGFASALRQDLHGTGVGVSTVLPGFIRDAGMFAESEVKLPRGTAEVDVAPFALRAGATFASVAPSLAETVARKLGSDQVSSQMAEGQASKR